MNDTTHATPIAALLAYANRRPGLEFGNYGDAPAYRSESRRIAGDLKRVARAADEFAMAHGTDADLLDATRGGRLTLEHSDGAYRVDYTTGQYWPTEYRPAVARVLESATSAAKQRAAAANPPFYPGWIGLRELAMSQLEGLNHEIGHNWFSRSAMRFFSTKIVSRAARISDNGARAYFVTSEQPPHDSRRYTVRYMTISGPQAGHVGTSGEFCAYSTGRGASDALRADLAEFNATALGGAL